jgi:ubiquinone/menaquinone biosynthesis C-methylase UbiE
MRDAFSFDDRVAARYNTQRAHPPEVALAIGKAVATHAGPSARVLELGIGTGRIAWPVAAAGLAVVGIDISPDMLTQVHPAPDYAAGRPLSLIQGDMHHLPFASGSFAAVLAVHVMHLARDWRVMLHEAARMLAPDGVLIQGEDWIDPASVTGRLRDEMRSKVAALAPHLRPPAADALAAMRQAVVDLGGRETTRLVAAEWTLPISPAERLRAIAHKTDAESWILTPDLFDTVLNHLRDFAAQTWGDLEAPQPVTRRFMLTVTRGVWGSAH